MKTALSALVASLARETRSSTSAPIAFLQAVTKDFRTNFGLAGGPPAPTTAARPAVRLLGLVVGGVAVAGRAVVDTGGRAAGRRDELRRRAGLDPAVPLGDARSSTRR